MRWRCGRSVRWAAHAAGPVGLGTRPPARPPALRCGRRRTVPAHSGRRDHPV